MNYGEKISQLRKSHGMTQEELGKVLNVTYQAVSKWERSESLPDFATMSQIAKYFQVPLDYFENDNATLSSIAHTDGDADAANIVGMCTVCGKALKSSDEYSASPKIVCKECKDRQEQEQAEKQKALEADAQRAEQVSKANMRRIAEANAKQQRGSGFDVKLIICIALAALGYIVTTVLCFTSGEDVYLMGAILMIVPLILFAVPCVIFDLIAELRDKDDDTEGYTLKLSLIVGAVFAAANIAVFAIVYFTLEKSGYFLGLLGGGAVISFAFVSQFMWGSAVKEIFTCGGFTFKLPGFIFSLTPESIIWMIVTKVFLGILSVLVFIATTVFFALIAIFGAVFTFVPCIIYKTVKDRAATKELRKA